MLPRVSERELVGFPLFADLTPSELSGLQEHCTVERRGRGDYVFRRGDVGETLYVIVSGQVAIEIGDGEARRVLALCGGTRLLDWLPLGPLRGGVSGRSVSLRSFQSLWYQLAVASSRTADVVFAPDLRGFWFLQFGAAAEIIEAGGRHAAELVPEIRATLAARVGLAVSCKEP